MSSCSCCRITPLPYFMPDDAPAAGGGAGAPLAPAPAAAPVAAASPAAKSARKPIKLPSPEEMLQEEVKAAIFGPQLISAARIEPALHS